MRYSIHFFAMDAAAVAERLRHEPDAIAEAVVARISAEGDPTEQDLVYSRQFAKNICTESFSDEDTAEELNTLCWMCEVLSEKIDIPEFNLFRSIDYLEDIGVWPLFQAERPPFPVPGSSKEFPQVGYLSRPAIEQYVADEFASLPPCNDPEADDARDDLLGIMESLCEDQLDLLAILVEV
ncbi:DUF7691 family protein [Symmachiella dynata]|uniref:DUF7691 family protein n=1 Tax=Symmachiella dynata TaxID=2527995 RepID=UPI0030ED821B